MKKQRNITKEKLQDWLTTKDQPSPTTQELDDTESTLLLFAAAHAQPPTPALREKILEKISMLNIQKAEQQPLDLDDLPIIDSSSNWLGWQALVANIHPPEVYESIHLHPLYADEKRELFVVWVKEEVEEEIHYDLLESFLILEGSCECSIEDEAGNSRCVRLSAGDFLTLQVGEKHELTITSGQPAKAILQYLKLAG